jgi:dTDP-glucose 4,6-dehydratase
MKRKLQNIMITGGAGFIGSNFIHYIFKQPGFKGRIINVDKLTYAGNLENLIEIDKQFSGSNYFFENADIKDHEAIKAILKKYDIDTIVHFAAESHVDRSIVGPGEFIQTNIMGTFSLLEGIRGYWKDRDDVLFHHVSTDEVYGSLDDSGYFLESTAYDPHSPYSASKASSDHLVKAYYHTYEIPVTISNCSNNYGPYQFPEKLIPLMILNMLNNKPLPVYGEGKNVRDWLFVDDHCAAIWIIMNQGNCGDTYNIGGDNEWENIKLIHALCEKTATILSKDEGSFKQLITFVNDRPGHDKRYAIDCSKIKKELCWKQQVDFSQGLDKTILWYLENKTWVEHIVNGTYKTWIELNYEKR